MLRDEKGRFRTSRFMAYGILVSVMVALIALAIQALTTSKPTEYKQEIVTVDTLTPKVEQLKDELMAKLESCESAGMNEEDGIVILDSNGRGSYGVLQWQRKSVMYYHEKRTRQKINGRDAILLALDADKARDLARWVIFETDSGLKDWVNCTSKYDLSGELKFIKKLI